MSENLDTLLYHIEKLAPTLPPVPPVNGAFTDPRQIAHVLQFLYEENWEYIGSHHVGGNGSTHLLGCGNETRPLYVDSRGVWYLARKDYRHFGDPDAAETARLLKFAREYKL